MLALLLCLSTPGVAPVEIPPAELAVTLSRFPPREVVSQNLCFAARYRCYLDGQQLGGWLGQEAYDADCDTKWRYAAWDLLDDVQKGISPRDRLTRLRHLIGPEAYAAGIMPCAVPRERFSSR